MAIHVALGHKTRYQYDRPVGLSPHIVRLRPAPHCRTPVLSYALKVSPEKHFINWQQDPHGNYLARIVFSEKTRELVIDVDLVAELSVYNPFDFFLESSAEQFPFHCDAWLTKDLAPYLEVPPAGPRLQQLLAGIDLTPRRTVDFLVDLNRDLSRKIEYVIRPEPGVQSPEETLARASGSCRDSGWLLVQTLRNLGLAARFVSGYLIQLTPDVKPLDGPAGVAADFTDLHAWAEVYLPGAGWIGLDPTSGLLAGEGHIPLAATPEPVTAAPVTGLVDECAVTFAHDMQVRRCYESPRVTKPYSADEWQAIDALGHNIDRELASGDVRLTMGGEPTFVSVDDMDGVEWNFEADSPRKRELAGALIRRLKRRFAPGGLLHFGQGKWYPGESLPRWALGCWWRRDGVPIWNDDALLADETNEYGHAEAEAKRFMEAVAQALRVARQHIIPAYEDVWHYLGAERRLPVNVDPLQSELKNAEDRARLARVFEQGLGSIVGYVLPLERDGRNETRSGWISGPWFLRREHLFLVPGDSPIGYRLPLDSLPWTAEEDLRPIESVDPFAPQRPFPSRQARIASAPARREPVAESMQPVRGQSASGIIRTALCVQPRGGRLYVFMPPVRHTEDYLDLVSAIEGTAASLGMPVILEGTTPPSDRRLNHLKVTPDPGVIEVNLQPAHNWSELVCHVRGVYEDARHTRLGTEKFMLDGRHSGTGGGNHLVVGGPTAADSPVLRRPDLLRSLLACWHNHPSLSYLFSGLFFGPTSQHPRVDEGRNDAVYELEIAFSKIPAPPTPDGAENAPFPPWTVDRVFRHLLVDVTGNTHRAEFCIDKLYAPETSSGREGLVELRSFEMPPHPEMSLAQQLLLRALIARFWKSPYSRNLVRWRTELHDRFMLPHFITEDLNDVIGDLQRAGYGVRPEWFAPHLEFRCPFVGAIAQRAVHLELRQALEPWYVLGEEPGGGGAVRYVDSSVERLQVKIRGLTDSRHFVTCNGRPIPLHPTGSVGEFVAGVRYRAWQPPSCLHPTIPVQAPLVFDIVDSWNERSLGGCTYYVAHPGGRNFERFPVNAYEAESRRLARFSPIGHTAGTMTVPAEDRDADYPLTLDLRRPPSRRGSLRYVLGLR